MMNRAKKIFYVFWDNPLATVIVAFFLTLIFIGAWFVLKALEII